LKSILKYSSIKSRISKSFKSIIQNGLWYYIFPLELKSDNSKNPNEKHIVSSLENKENQILAFNRKVEEVKNNNSLSIPSPKATIGTSKNGNILIY